MFRSRKNLKSAIGRVKALASVNIVKKLVQEEKNTEENMKFKLTTLDYIKYWIPWASSPRIHLLREVSLHFTYFRSNFIG